jgi:hypothetical protein
MIRFCTWYICDLCNKPIIDAPVVDPKAGYHPWPAQLPENARQLSARQPRVTYHVECAKQVFKHMKREKRYKHVPSDVRAAADRIFKRIKKKKYTLEKLALRYKRKIKLDIIKKALRVLRREEKIRKRKGGYVAR